MTTYRFGGDTVTGIAALNDKRAGLVSLANRFYRKALDCQTFDEEEELTSRFISQFMQEIAVCFACEEEMMAACYYSDREDHQQEHDEFTARLYALRRRHKLGEPAMSIEIFQEIREWFLSHWEYADGRLFPFFDRIAMFSAMSSGNGAAVPAGSRDVYGPAETSPVN